MALLAGSGDERVLGPDDRVPPGGAEPDPLRDVPGPVGADGVDAEAVEAGSVGAGEVEPAEVFGPMRRAEGYQIPPRSRQS